MKLKVKRLTETAILPEKAYPTEACYDVFADEAIQLIKEETTNEQTASP